MPCDPHPPLASATSRITSVAEVLARTLMRGGVDGPSCAAQYIERRRGAADQKPWAGLARRRARDQTPRAPRRLGCPRYHSQPPSAAAAPLTAAAASAAATIAAVMPADAARSRRRYRADCHYVTLCHKVL